MTKHFVFHHSDLFRHSSFVIRHSVFPANSWHKCHDVFILLRYTPIIVQTRTITQRKTALHGAVAIIERDGKILLQRRREHIADPGTWVLPGGECRRGELPREALVRALAEEMGITVRPSKEIGMLELADSSCPVWHVVWKGKELTLAGKDILGIGWCTPEELLELSPLRNEAELKNFFRGNDMVKKLCNRSDVLPQENIADSRVEDDALPENIDNSLEEERILALVERSKNDDHEAFAELYDLYITPIHRYVAFRLPPAIAEDTVADIFVKAWEKLGSYTGRKGTPFSSWLFRIARNVVIDTYRTRKETVELNEMEEDKDRWNNPKLLLTQEVQANLLRQAMGKLPRRSREVLLLSFMANLSHGEIARSLRMREGSVRIMKHRALKKLAELLPPSMQEELP
jgi:RNA polymerase sigma-70 factor (ECF subfamily)